MASVTITNTIAKCFKNKATGRTMNWWKTSFNMPVPNIFEDNSIYTETEGMLDAQGAGTSFDLTGFQLGWEAFACNSVFTIYGPFSGGTAVIGQKWYHPNGTLIFENGPVVFDFPSLVSGQWTSYQLVSNQGVAEWEINQNGTYRVVAEIYGAINGTQTTYITVTGCPAMEQHEQGYVWVDGNNLCWVSANGHKHTMYGRTYTGPVGSQYAGSIRIEGENIIWIGVSGYQYLPKYNIRQFESTFSNGAPGVVSGKQPGYFYMDNEFGWEHISYIDAFGYKWLLNSGANPYFFGSEP